MKNPLYTELSANALQPLLYSYYSQLYLTTSNRPYWLCTIPIHLPWLYAAFMESALNLATLGKKAMRLKVTTIDGQPVNFGQATSRHFNKFVSSIILLIGYFMMLWDENKQTLHDKLAGAFVVKR